jgi:hypothetical protein
MTSQKTLEDLAKQVIDSQSGLMSVDDLRVFFEDTPVATNPETKPTVEPVIAPVPPVTPSVAPTAEAVVSQPDVRDFVPERFRDVDAKTSVEKLTRSYAELEAELNKEREERARLNKLLEGETPTVPIATAPTPAMSDFPTDAIGNQADTEVDDSMFFEKPTEATTKVASKVAAAMLVAYHNALSEASKRMQYVENFKAAHSDFNEYKEDMALVLKNRPDLDKKVESLPTVYEMAKARYRARLERMRKELGVETKEPVPTVPVKPGMTEAELVERVKSALLAEVNRRRAATGITGGGPPVNPSERTQAVVSVKPITPEEQIFADMMGSGPKKLDLNL